MRRKHSPQLKAKAALEAMKGLRPVNEIAGDFDGLPELFSKPDKHRKRDDEALTSRLYEEVGRLKVELDWLKKKSEQLR